MKTKPKTDWNHFALQPKNERMLFSAIYIAREVWYNDCPQLPLGHTHTEHDYALDKSHPLNWLVWECYDTVLDYAPYYNSILAPVAGVVKRRNERAIRYRYY